MVASAEGVALVGPALLNELGQAIEYATGLGIGMADLPAPAIEWVAEWERINGWNARL
jgi:hypothetical protein